jgi:hypothetical protein
MRDMQQGATLELLHRVRRLEQQLAKLVALPPVPGADHGALAGLGDDDHSQYVLLAGRVAAQVVLAGSASLPALRAQAAASPTVAALQVADSAGTLRHELWANFGTNIPGTRRMGGVQEFWIAPGNITTLTLTVDVLGTQFARQPVIMEVQGAFFNNSDGTTVRALWVDDVSWSTRANNATNATLGFNTRRAADINGVTVTGPTAIPAGVRYTVKGSANLVRAGMRIMVVSAAAVTVTASVA